MAIMDMHKSVLEVQGHWQHYFDNLKFSTQEFYQTIDAIVKAQEIPKLKTSRITYSEGGLFSSNREYLRISREKLVFDVCAAPFGKGFFASSWQGILPSYRRSLIGLVPFVGKSLQGGFDRKTYYQMDVEQMFASAVHQCILQGVDDITSKRGIRQLSEMERVFHNQK